MDNKGNVLSGILDYTDLNKSFPMAMGFLEKEKIKPKSDKKHSEDQKIEDNELKNILKAAKLLLTIKAGMGAEKFKNTLERGLNGELDWFGNNTEYKPEKKTGQNQNAGQVQKLTFTFMVNNLVTGRNGDIRTKNLTMFFSNEKFDTETIKKINSIFGIEEKETNMESNININKEK